MKKYLLIVLAAGLVIYYTGLWHAFENLFKDDQGHMNWQYVANWSSGLLITILSIVSVILYRSRQETERVNRELEAIKNQLELRVKERTATLDEANRLLKEEIQQHLETTNRLHSSEAYLRSVLQSMPTVLIGLDANGTVSQWNQRAELNTGIPAKEAIGRNLWEVYPIITVTEAQVKEVMDKGEPVNFQQSQRGLFHYDVTLFPLKETAEPGVVILIDDVTNQVKSENKLIHRDKMSAMGEMAASMAHDIDVPIQSILSDVTRASELLNSVCERVGASACPELAGELGRLSDELNDVIRQGEQATAIVNNLLQFAASHDHSRQQVDVTEVMDHVLELARSVLVLPQGLRFSDLIIERDYDQDLPPFSCVLSEFQQVLLSVLRHCFHALGDVDREGFVPTIRIRILECYDALWIKISHNGQGLTEEEQQHLFEPYFGGEPGAGQEADAGKRLSFPYFIVTEHHEGQMAVTSDVKLGTTFHMQFQLD